jgi:hypothetical protein
VDGQPSFRLQNPERIAQRTDRDTEQFHEVLLRQKGAGFEAAIEQRLQEAVASQVAQAATRAGC